MARLYDLAPANVFTPAARAARESRRTGWSRGCMPALSATLPHVRYRPSSHTYCRVRVGGNGAVEWRLNREIGVVIHVERVDYIRIPVAGMEEANEFDGQVLGLKRNPNSPADDWVEYGTSNVTLCADDPADALLRVRAASRENDRVACAGRRRSQGETRGSRRRGQRDVGFRCLPWRRIRAPARETRSSSTVAARRTCRADSSPLREPRPLTPDGTGGR